MTAQLSPYVTIVGWICILVTLVFVISALLVRRISQPATLQGLYCACLTGFGGAAILLTWGDVRSASGATLCWFVCSLLVAAGRVWPPLLEDP
jgi:hypothetical protein